MGQEGPRFVHWCLNIKIPRIDIVQCLAMQMNATAYYVQIILNATRLRNKFLFISESIGGHQIPLHPTLDGQTLYVAHRYGMDGLDAVLHKKKDAAYSFGMKLSRKTCF